jgi:G3E family GTPase
MALLRRREDRTAAYDRVLIETSGLSDPAPLLQSMMTDAAVAATHRLPFVLTLVDTEHGEATLREHAEARAQVVLADRVLISKTDLRPASDQLLAAVDGLNPDALRMATSDADPAAFFDQSSIGALTQRLARTPRRVPHSGIETFTIERDRPLPALALTLLLQAVAEHCGARLLRLKGLVDIEEMPGQPAVIHGVRHVVSAPEFLQRWPGGDVTTRIVLITKDVPRFFVSRLLDAIEEEVRDATAQSRG